MPISLDGTASFDIDLDGDASKTNFKGVFKVKTRLSFRDQLRIDQIRRDLLGPDPAGNASGEAMAIAIALADLAVHVIEAPLWWKEAKNGIELQDENVLLLIWEKTKEAKRVAIEGDNKEADEAKGELREARAKVETGDRKAAEAARKK